MRRRFIFDPVAGCVVEVGLVRETPSAAQRYADAQDGYRDVVNRDPSRVAGARLTAAALERADRREFAARRYGDERRWSNA